jgi:arylsulfatase A-like enzyme/Tfp pilus assembly protein PilF
MRFVLPAAVLLSAVGLVLALPVAGDVRAAQLAERPNVLLVTIDTLRWDALGSYGGPAATPALDRLAAQGVRFERVTAHATVTLPSHVSILAGLDPTRHGVHNNTGFRAGDELFTWAERLRQAGYATAAFIGAFPLDSQFGLAQGFDLYDDHYSVGGASNDFGIVERPAGEVVRAARQWIAGQPGSWFAWVHVYEPHAPYEPPEPFAVDYRDNPYAGEVAAVDAALASLLDEVTSKGALVIVTSDHGEGLGQHGELTHGLFAYDSTLRVPLIMARRDDIPAGTVVSDWVRHIDVLPTVLEQLELPLDDLQGSSLMPLIRGAPENAGPGVRTAYFETLTPYLTRGWAPLRGLREGRHKYIDLPLAELYDVDADPAETDNLLDRQDQRAAGLRAALEEHLAEGKANEDLVPTRETELTLQRLRALGYIGDSTAPAPDRVFGPDDDPKGLVELDRKVHEAVEASRLEDWQTAAARLEEVVAVRPDFAWAYSLLAAVAYRRGELDIAVRHLEETVDSGLTSPFLLNKLAFYLRMAGRPAEARQALEDSEAQEPDNVETLDLLGGVLAEMGEGAAALEVFRRALAMDPTQPSLHANRGAALLSSGRDAEAVTAFDTALRYDADFPEAHNGLGVVAARRGNLDEAVEHWRRAVALDPELFDALYNLGITLTRLNRFEEAIAVLEAFVERAPEERYAEDIAGVRRLLARLKGR